MNCILPIALFVALSGAAAHAQSIEKCVRGDSNFLYQNDLDNKVPCQAPPPSGDTPLMIKSGPLLSIFQNPCCVNFQTKAGIITMDLDNGTVDLHGAKLDDAARAFWDAVAQVTSHPAVKQRAYTLDDIDQMRVAVVKVMTAEYQAYIIQQTGLTTIVPHPLNSDVEDRLRIYMSAGITPEELEARTEKP